MDRFFELRLELTTAWPSQAHLSMFVTDEHGQWSLLDDWTAETPQEVDVALNEAVSFVDGWLMHGVRQPVS